MRKSESVELFADTIGKNWMYEFFIKLPTVFFSLVF